MIGFIAGGLTLAAGLAALAAGAVRAQSVPAPPAGGSRPQPCAGWTIERAGVMAHGPASRLSAEKRWIVDIAAAASGGAAPQLTEEQANALLHRVDGYCRKHPSQSVVEAVKGVLHGGDCGISNISQD